VVEELEKAAASTGPKGKGKEGADGSSPIGDLKTAYEKELDEIANGKEPSSKKQKSDLAARLDAYGVYKDLKNDDLKDTLRWNKQFVTGTKDFLIAKVVDGRVYGRLAACHLCGGKIKMNDDGKMIKCGGTFDEESQRRMECSFSCPTEAAPRWQPW
jgi:hypothetical protein